MPIYKVFHFTIADSTFALKDRFTSNELQSAKYYLFEVSTSDTIIYFKFNTNLTSNVIIEVFSNPTIGTNGTFLLNPLSLVNIYSDPIVSNNGTYFYKYDTNTIFIDIHTLELAASTNYLMKITPLDYNDTTLGLKSKDELDSLKDILKDVSKINESKLELISMINSINNNSFSNSDIIPAIKKLAIAEKNIINMLLTI